MGFPEVFEPEKHPPETKVAETVDIHKRICIFPNFLSVNLFSFPHLVMADIYLYFPHLFLFFYCKIISIV